MQHHFQHHNATTVEPGCLEGALVLGIIFKWERDAARLMRCGQFIEVEGGTVGRRR